MIKLSDIARALNISEATVSNAFTGKGRMKPETREAILSYATEMGYQARKPKISPEKKQLIIISEGLNSSFVNAILTGIQEKAGQLGLTIPTYSLNINDAVLCRNPDIRQLNARVYEILAEIDYPVSGILYISQYARRVDGLLDTLSLPVLFVYCSREDGREFIHYDDHQGAYLAVNTLLQEGRTKVAMISGPIDCVGMYLRSAGYQQALMEHQLPYDPRLVRIGDWDEASGYEQTCQLLSENQDFDAIFAQSDLIAFGASRALREKGLNVPEDVSIIGFDNIPACQFFEPPLTSIQPPFEGMGAAALTRLLELLETGSMAENISGQLLPCQLILRSSTQNKIL